MATMAPPRRRRSRRVWRDTAVGWSFILPNFLGFALLTLVPVVVLFYLAFTNWNIFGTAQWTGVANLRPTPPTLDSLPDETLLRQPDRRSNPTSHSDLPVCAREVMLCGLSRDPQDPTDLIVGLAVGGEQQHLYLPVG